MNRAYATITIKAVNEQDRTIEGIASTPTPDRAGDIVEPMGAKFSLPLPFLWQHDSEQPIGHVISAKPNKTGIPFRAKLLHPDEVDSAILKERLQLAWDSIKTQLVRGVSIGFRILEYSIMADGGWHISSWEWLENSAVTIPANIEASITSIKRFDTGAPAATGTNALPSNVNPPATGKSLKSISIRPQEGQRNMIKNVGAQIADLEAKRKETATAMEAIQTKSSAENRTKDADERKQFNELRDALKLLDDEIEDLKAIEAIYTPDASKAVAPGNDPAPKPYQRMTPAVKKPEEKGMAFARVAKVKAVARLDGMTRAEVAEKMYGKDSETFHIIKANEVAAGTNISGNWAADLVSSEGAAAADFAEYLRPSTIIGKFGQNGVPPLRAVPFRKPLILGTGGGAGFWVGEAKPKPMTAFDFDRSTLDPLKCATIAVLSMENIRDSSPASDGIVRDELRNVLVALQDSAFIDPANAGTSNVKPVSVLYGSAAIAAESYTDEADVILDVRSLLQKFIDANNPASQAVLIMQEGTALACSLILNAMGNRAFPELTMRGGSLLGIPVITSESVPAGIVGIVNASDIFIGDDGDIIVDMSTEASLEMSSAPTQNPVSVPPGTGASLVSLWQNNLVGFRAERTVNWKRRRDSAAAYLTGVAWGGAVNVS